MAQPEELNYHFKWENHPNDAFPKFYSLFQQRRFLDVTLVAAEGRTLKTHRLILSCSSQYFEVKYRPTQCEYPSINKFPI